MNVRTRFKPPVPVAAIALAVLLSAGCCSVTSATEPDVVGVLALVEKDAVAKELAMTEGQKRKLRELIDRREAEAVELVYLPRAERAERLAAFRRQSEEKGLALLNPQQRARLEQIRVRTAGLATLAEPAISEKLGLTTQQKGKVSELLEQHNRRVSGADQKTKRLVRTDMERKLSVLLTDRQRADWEALAGGNAPQDAPPEPAEAATEEPTEPLKVAADQSAETTPLRVAADQSAETTPLRVAADQSAQPTVELADRPPKKPGKLRFNFRYQPWKDVLEWFADQADLSYVPDFAPEGTFNYTDSREYTPAEAIDLLNSVLLTKGYTLIRRDRMLMLVNLEDGIPPNLVSTIPLEELDEKGEYELVSVLFQLEKTDPEEIEPEISKLIGPQGAVVTLTKARQILVTETAGRLRAIRSVIQRIEDPQGLQSGEMRALDLQFALPEEAVAVVRQLLNIPEDQNATSDGSLRFAVDPAGSRLLVSGNREKLARVEEILKIVDVPGPGRLEVGHFQEPPQLEVYSITTADSESVLAVMQTLLAGLPDVRLAIDSKTGNLVALARPPQHKTIRATLEQMQRDARMIEVIYLQRVDPQLAVLSISKLFGTGKEDTKGNAPRVDADPTSRQLLVRGTKSQIEQIRSLLEKMGETDTKNLRASKRRNVRMLPLTGQAAETALEGIQQIWPTMRRNKIRVVTPSAVSPSMRSGSPSGVLQHGQRLPAPRMRAPRRPAPREAAAREPAPDGPLPAMRGPETERRGGQTPPQPAPGMRGPGRGGPGRRGPGRRGPGRPGPIRPMPQLPQPESALPEVPPREDKSAGRPAGLRVLFASQAVTADPQPVEPPLEVPPPPEGPSPPDAAAGEPAPIIVAPTPGGLMIACEDLEALDDFEDLLTAMAGNLAGGGPELTIFYLKHAKAAVVAETLDEILGGGTIAAEDGGGGGLIGDLAGAALGNAGGGILGSLLGLGGGSGSIAPSGPTKITPDARLNALIVQASPADLDMIEQLLKILDQKGSPEDILVVSKAKMIPVFNTQAEQLANILKEVYQDRMVASSRGGGRSPSPEEFIRMLRGNRRGAGGSKRGSNEQQQKMSIGVDTRTNSLIVAAPEPLLAEVEQLVEQLDRAALEANDQSVRIVTLHKTSPEAVQRALAAMMGDAVQTGGSSRGSARSRARSGGPPGPPPDSPDARRAFFMEMMRRRFEGRPAPPDGPPGQPPARPPRHVQPQPLRLHR